MRVFKTACFSLVVAVATAVATNYPLDSPNVGVLQDHRYPKPSGGNFASFTGSIRINGPASRPISNEELVGFVAAGYAQMSRATTNANRPGVLTGLAVGNHIYFGSSVKGLPRAQMERIVRNTQIRALLRLCTSSTLTEHSKLARCGEFNAMQYYSEHNGQIPVHDSTARIVTVSGSVRGGGPGNQAVVRTVQIEPPCSDNEREGSFGCATVLRQTNFRVIPPSTAIGIPRALPAFTITT
jgi:hypothetical protein